VRRRARCIRAKTRRIWCARPSGSFNIRENIVGTSCELVILYFSTSSKYCSGSKRSMITLVAPRRIAPESDACGAEWYIGSRRQIVHSLAEAEHELQTPATVGAAPRDPVRAADAGCPSVDRSCPTSTTSPRRVARSRRGSLDTSPWTSSYGSNGPSGSSASSMIQRSTLGHSAGSCSATSRFAFVVNTTRAVESLTM